MIGGKKIGVGIVTYNRPEQFSKLLLSLENCSSVDSIVVVNDGDLDEEYYNVFKNPKLEVVLHNQGLFGKNLGVGKSKNLCIKHLLRLDSDYIFIIEDDIYIKDPTVFEKYIEASNKTGIQHFNFSQHGMMNKSWPGGDPNPTTIINYDSNNLPIHLYPHCVGAFSYYTKACLDKVGLLDERYYNACEHVDHTLSIIEAGMHPPFWSFADIADSNKLLGDEEWSLNQSQISGKPGHDNIVSFADEVFKMKHGCTPGQVPHTSWDDTVKILKEIKNTYAIQ